MANNELQFINEVVRIIHYNMSGATLDNYNEAYGILQHLANHLPLHFTARQADELEGYAHILRQARQSGNNRVDGINHRFIPRMINRLIYDQVIDEPPFQEHERGREFQI